MNEPTEPKRARGHALPRSAMEIDRISQVTDRAIASARRDWKLRVPDPLRGLIDAKAEPEE